MSRKLEAQTQRLELLIAQSMANENILAKQPESRTMHENTPYADEGDEVSSFLICQTYSMLCVCVCYCTLLKFMNWKLKISRFSFYFSTKFIFCFVRWWKGS